MYPINIKINDVPTEIITFFPTSNEETVENIKQDVIVIITGNPGVPAFYKEFAICIQKYLSCELPIWIIGHTGHTRPELSYSNYQDIKAKKHLYTLNGNLEHKVKFITDHIPSNARIHLIGHSIGCWFALNLLKNHYITKRVIKCYLLFPTIERMAESPNGWFLTNVVLRLLPIIIFVSWIFTIFPYFLQEFLVKIFGLVYGYSSKYIVDAILQMIHPISLEKIFLLAKDEMTDVKTLDDTLISKYNNKLFMYYGNKDGWTPIRYYEELKIKHPDINAQLCKQGYQHSFVLKNSIEIGKMIANLINESIFSLNK